MNARDTNASEWRLDLADEAATQSLARRLAELVGPNDLVTLSGDLGAGKTTFARALIRHIVDDPTLEAPSPTFTLMQVYQGPRGPIVHADLYRIRSADELVELGWDEAAEGALVLVEWADRIGSDLPSDRLDVAFFTEAARGAHFRRAIITGHGAMAPRLARARGVDTVLAQAGFADARRSFMLGDASTRAYERLLNPDGSRAILMISPPRPDGPAVRFGKPYSGIARLAEDIRPFIAVGQALRAQGVSAPRILSADLSVGLAVLEDLGSDPFVDDNGPIAMRYGEAAGLLASLHSRDLPADIPLGDTHYAIPPYDIEAMLIEVELLTEWYAPHAGFPLNSGVKATFLNLWREALQGVIAGPQTWTLRDYHSPNLIWLKDREGLQRVGVIDFQDCVMGPPAYDVASLLQDARVTVPDDLEIKLLGHYARQRKGADAGFDMSAFARDYALMGAQRATKVLGIFARLDKRDGKPQYLAHMPRVRRYLAKGLAHPALAGVRAWHEAHLPGALDATA